MKVSGHVTPWMVVNNRTPGIVLRIYFSVSFSWSYILSSKPLWLHSKVYGGCKSSKKFFPLTHMFIYNIPSQRRIEMPSLVMKISKTRSLELIKLFMSFNQGRNTTSYLHGDCFCPYFEGHPHGYRHWRGMCSFVSPFYGFGKVLQMCI